MNDLSRRVDVLQSLSPTELDTLQLRCQGRTSAEIAQAQFVSETEARNTLGHLYDTLWLTHLPRERRLDELRGWSDVLRDARERELLADRFRGYVPQPPTGTPPEAALAAVVADDEVITSWHGPAVAVPVAGSSGRRRLPPWWPGIVAVVALLFVGGLAFLTLGGDDDDANQAIVPTIPVSPSATVDTSAAVATTTAASAPATEPAPATSTATEEIAASTATVPSVSPTRTSTPRASPTRSTTGTGTATARVSPTPRATATATATTALPTATPSIIYEANWSQDLNGWTGDEGWRVENGVLIFDGQGGSRTFWSPVGIPDDRDDYAIEAEILVNNGTYTSAVAGFSTRDASNQASPNGQVATVVSTGGWHTYRLEVRDGAALFSVDGTVVGDFDDERLESPDQLGIFAVATRIEVRTFRVVPL